MLKRALHISFIFLLLISTSGVTFYKHYCGDSLISASIGHEPKKCCGDDCKGCHNESKTYKITDNYEFSKSNHEFKAVVKNIYTYSLHDFTYQNINIDFYNNKVLTSLIKVYDSPSLITENLSAKLQIFRL